MIAPTYETQFLGIIIQANLKWSTHIVVYNSKIDIKIDRKY